MSKQQVNLGRSTSTTKRARNLRADATPAETAVWQLLRGSQLCGLKFRRQHPIGPFIADFACVSEKLVVELDGGYHEQTLEKDNSRQAYLECSGWRVLRFSNADALESTEGIGRVIAAELRMEYEIQLRKCTDSGMSACMNAPGTSRMATSRSSNASITAVKNTASVATVGEAASSFAV